MIKCCRAAPIATSAESYTDTNFDTKCPRDQNVKDDLSPEGHTFYGTAGKITCVPSIGARSCVANMPMLWTRAGPWEAA